MARAPQITIANAGLNSATTEAANSGPTAYSSSVNVASTVYIDFNADPVSRRGHVARATGTTGGQARPAANASPASSGHQPGGSQLGTNATRVTPRP
ncbi:hypothetical protein EV192_1011285 [Actinocrispum wychmicini]|uniref:Uncharacterized protein n=1 Tax=Actinocrispum wychmicini TaxID=1213861 RepID=A0A4R2JY28_9PSEU|nr:hypothetical protein [Actinocrispum wychmicini]TCO65493.1 hypothetical protein EV192_1011285 [Actinocrispum wychmicini]